MRTCTRPIEIVEVSARDGLQNKTVVFTTAQKIALIGRAAPPGARRIEVASFVRADRVPQMADAEAVLDGLTPSRDVTTIGRVMNERGARRALATRVDELGAVTVAIDAFPHANQGQTSRQSAQVAADVIHWATGEGRRAQATIRAAFGCPPEGEVDPAHVVALAETTAAAGGVEVALTETIGVAVSDQVAELVGRSRDLPIRVHLHNTRGTGVANAWAAIDACAATLDAAFGGIGGCPFAPAATGNIATEELLYMLDRSGIATGCDLDRTIATACWPGEEKGPTLPGLVARAGKFPQPHAHAHAA
jgi:hydroxymethylglutaryl-CoA lyase